MDEELGKAWKETVLYTDMLDIQETLENCS
jgi:hypothetical protein